MSSSPAPPPAVWLRGSQQMSSNRGVGRHQQHLRDTVFSSPLPCATCHKVPAAVTSTGHMDSPLPAEVSFGALARGGTRKPALGMKPTWDTKTLTCKGTYCHALDGATYPAPSWTGDKRVKCGGCHGLPPVKTASGKKHPPSPVSECVDCHGAVVDKTGAITTRAKHVNGEVDFK